ncbi:WG repeat-containing protein [Actinoplanes friuliensis]|uniref:Aggrecan core protein n=1 Tax=Actinoplanes friuliensis DSM 7358 TaxID=1246995 RepID=U5VWR5_9ACTN|nr:WG repeat-containing protein [Actinoplanes friuliensis]AGZ40150.1 Aggrecan core protein [Actinoplanes friuliensis DSM 7358]
MAPVSPSAWFEGEEPADGTAPDVEATGRIPAADEVEREAAAREDAAPEAAAEGDEGHGLGWLLSMSGLGAVTREPEPVSPAPADLVAETPDITADAPVSALPVSPVPVSAAPVSAVPVSGPPQKQDWFSPTTETRLVVPKAAQEETEEAAPPVTAPAQPDEVTTAPAQPEQATTAPAEQTESAEVIGAEPVEAEPADEEPAVDEFRAEVPDTSSVDSKTALPGDEPQDDTAPEAVADDNTADAEAGIPGGPIEEDSGPLVVEAVVVEGPLVDGEVVDAVVVEAVVVEPAAEAPAEEAADTVEPATVHATVGEPITAPEPVTVEDPVATPEPVSADEPVQPGRPDAVDEPAQPSGADAFDEPALAETGEPVEAAGPGEPAAEDEPAPTEAGEPVADDEPVADYEPVTDYEPVADYEPVTDYEPVADYEPVTDYEPVADDEPVTVDEPAIAETSATVTVSEPAAAEEEDEHVAPSAEAGPVLAPSMQLPALSVAPPPEPELEPLRRRADPEQILATYPWTFDERTLREVVDDPDRLLDVRDRLTDKLEYAERDTVRARLLSLRAVVSRVLGDLGRALADAREALRHAEATGELRRTAIVQARLAHVQQWRGDFAEADRIFEEANSVELPDRLRAEMHVQAGKSCYEQGRYLEACNHFEAALELRRVEDPDLVARTEAALDAVMARVREAGWGPYPRSREEILQQTRPPHPAVDYESGWQGYADSNGDVVIGERYADAQPFHEGAAWVRRPGTDAWELIDETGGLLIDSASGYVQAGPFGDGLAWVSRDPVGGWFAVDWHNRVIVPGGFDDVRPFRRGLAAVKRGGWGAIDRHGRVVVQPKFRRFATELIAGGPVEGFTADGLAVVDAGDRLGVVDRTGQFLVAPVHARLVIHPVAFIVGDREGRWGALDRGGEPIVDVVHSRAADVVDEIERLLSDTRPVL